MVVVATAVDVIALKGCRFSVRADTTYVVSLVAYVVDSFVLNFVRLFVVVSCKYSCNVLCNLFCSMCCKNTLVDCAYSC